MPDTITRDYPVFGMTCATCAINVEKALQKQTGVETASVNLAANQVHVVFQAGVTPAQLQNAVRNAGYDMDVSEQIDYAATEERRAAELQSQKRKLVVAILFSIPVLLFGMVWHHSFYGRWISMMLSGFVVFYLGRQFFVSAYKQLINSQLGMDVLVAVSTGVSWCMSAINTIYPTWLTSKGFAADVYFESAAVVVTFVMLGKYLEEQAKSGAAGAIKKLMSLQPDTITVIRGGVEVTVKEAEVLVNEVMLVKPGERIAADGVVAEGESYVDESMINGEPLPTTKHPGMQVFAGTINQNGMLKITITCTGKQTLLQQIVRAVQQAQSSKPPVQQLVDRVAAVFVPAVMLISVLTFLLWYFIGGSSYLVHGIVSSVTVLVVACPCALGLATPTALMAGIGRAAESGVLIREITALEQISSIDVVLLDKTGTITTGKPSVVADVWLIENKGNYPHILRAIESLSEHPLAGAVAKYFQANQLPFTVTEFKSITGKGISAVVDGSTYYIGSERLMQEKLVWVTPDALQSANTYRGEGATVIFFARNNDLLAYIAIADPIKDSSLEAIQHLKQHHRVIMLTGDDQITASSTAHKVGIDEFHSGMMPAGKAQFVNSIKAENLRVMMVGDGINDSEALALADVSMAMGNGADLAMSVADITLLSNDLAAIRKAMKISVGILSTIRINLFWAFIYNLIGIPIAAGLLFPLWGIQMNPMVAGAAMAFSSVSVVLNSLRLRYRKF